MSYSLLDIGRDMIKAAVVLIIPDNPEPQLVGYGQVETGNHDITGGRLEAEAVTRSVNEALTQAEDSAEKYLGQKIVPDDVIFALAGRATVGKLFTVKQKRSNPKEPVTVRELQSLRNRAEKLVRKGLSEDFFEGGQWLPLAVNEAGIRLDNHLVLDGIGLVGREMSLSVFGVSGQAGALRALEVLANRLDLAITNIIASPQALASVVPCAESVILDVGLSGTDVCLTKDDALVGADWTPFGGHFFTKSLARLMDIEPASARLLKHAFANNELDETESLRVESHLIEPCRRWYNAVLELLKGLSPDQPLPRRVFMTGGGSLLPGLTKALRADPTPFDAAPVICQLGANSTLTVKNLTEALDYNLFALTLSLTVGLPE